MYKLILFLLAFGFIVYQINRSLDRVMRFFRIFEGKVPQSRVKVRKEGNVEIRYTDQHKTSAKDQAKKSSEDDYVDFEEVD